MSLINFVYKIPFLRKPYYNLLYTYIARRQRKHYIRQTDRLKELKDSHKGGSCFIIGTGPSLRDEDLITIKNTGMVTFAPNRIYEICDRLQWYPTYYICQDHNIIKTFGERIHGINCRLAFLPVEYASEFPDDKFRFFVLRERDFYPHNAKFSNNASRWIDQGYTVTYGAIQLAIYMGFKKIYLLGIDHNYTIIRDASGRPVRSSTATTNYPQGMTDYANQQNLPRVEESTIAYETARQFADKHGVKIINLTRGGKLEAFERGDFDTKINSYFR